MTRTRVAALLGLGSLLAAGCLSASPVQPESSRQNMTSSDTRPITAGPVRLAAPAGWHVQPGSLNPSGNVTLAYLSPLELPSECQVTAQGGVCHAWPALTLGAGAIVVAVRQHGMPGAQAPAGGDLVTVGGLPARRISGSADEECRAIGGTESIAVVLPAVPETTGWIALDACIAGPGAGSAAAAFAAIVASVMVAGAGASPS